MIRSRLLAIVLLAVLHPESRADQPIITLIQMDRIEYLADDEDWVWDMQGWVGGDTNKFWWKTEGEFSDDDAEVQLLYSKAVSAYWDLQIGLKHTLKPTPAENAAVIGLQGLAPQWFEVDIAAFLTEDGHLEARAEVEYDLLVTQRLILQPRLELDSEEDSTDLSLRLRYEIRREIAPYIGVGWNKSHGQDERVSFIAGARFWF